MKNGIDETMAFENAIMYNNAHHCLFFIEFDGFFQSSFKFLNSTAYPVTI